MNKKKIKNLQSGDVVLCRCGRENGCHLKAEIAFRDDRLQFGFYCRVKNISIIAKNESCTNTKNHGCPWQINSNGTLEVGKRAIVDLIGLL
jgi:hypothetical protein